MKAPKGGRGAIRPLMPRGTKTIMGTIKDMTPKVTISPARISKGGAIASAIAQMPRASSKGAANRGSITGSIARYTRPPAGQKITPRVDGGGGGINRSIMGTVSRVINTTVPDYGGTRAHRASVRKYGSNR